MMLFFTMAQMRIEASAPMLTHSRMSTRCVDLQAILEKADMPNQPPIATSSTMGGFWS
jgi:hypothetical protein